jgi:hypothetical protein
MLLCPQAPFRLVEHLLSSSTRVLVGLAFLEKISVDKKHEPHAFNVFTVPGANGEEATERWKYKALWGYEKNTGWQPAASGWEVGDWGGAVEAEAGGGAGCARR